MINSRPKVDIYPLSNYSHRIKKAKKEKYTCAAQRLSHFVFKYREEGRKTSVEGLLLVHEHNHPHVLMLKRGNIFYKLPGGKLKPGEDEIEGLKRKLTRNLAFNQPEFQPDWQIGQQVAIWWRPHFSKHMYPYCPPNIEKPIKEVKKIFIVHLSNRQSFAVPRNYDLVAVPFFELYDNAQGYGPVYASIPLQLSRFNIRTISPSFDVSPRKLTHLKSEEHLQSVNSPMLF